MKTHIKKFLQHKISLIVLACVVLAVMFLVGVYVGKNHAPSILKITSVIHKDPQVTTEADFEPFWKVWNLINEKYPSASKIDDQKRIYGAIEGLVSSLEDPYSVFFPPAESESFGEMVRGNFTGVGMEVGIKDKVLTVIAPLKGTPAYKAGIKSGDKILKIDATVTNNMTVENAIKLIRGEKGTSVTLTIFRDGDKEPQEIKIVRDVIELPTLDTEKRSDGIFVIKLYNFSEHSPELFQKALIAFADSGSTKLLLDLRGNPGGYLDAAVDMASWFLPVGKIVVSEDFGGNAEPRIYRSKGYDIFNEELRMVILVDNGSASASEILAGSLNEHGVAKLVGTQTYGKGSVQELVKVTDTTSLKITVAKWLTPKGISISEKGLTPDYLIPVTKADIAKKKDPQLAKAVQLLLQQ
jgi:carboxyl-terminal processing protease